MRIGKYFIIILFLILVGNSFFLKEVNAETHELESLDIHVFIEDDGSATITENRIATLSRGTENFINIGNLGKSTITDFVVYENGEKYEYADEWNIHASQDKKTYKNSIIHKKDRYELVWGIGEYGQHEYELQYKVTDFIKQLDDSQMLFWQFLNSDTNIPPKKVSVTIETDSPLTKQTEKTWAFGYDGDIHFKDGKVIATNYSPLSKSDYVTILLQFSADHFHTNDVIPKSFEEVKEEAFKNSNYSNDYGVDYWVNLIVVLILIVGGFLFIAFMIFKISDYFEVRKYKGKYRKDLPYDGPFPEALHLISISGFANDNQILSAFFFKWINEERVEIIYKSRPKFFKREKVDGLRFLKDKKAGLKTSEAALFQTFFDYSVNGVIKKRDFRRWTKGQIDFLFDKVWKILRESIDACEAKGILTQEEWIDSSGKISPLLNHEQAIIEEFKDHVHLFRNYLTKMSSFHETDDLDKDDLDTLFIWAILLGVEKNIYKEFKVLFPTSEQRQNSPVPSIARRAILKHIRGMNRRLERSSRSSGFGGSASSGGGGGSFGGGSGGGTR